MAFISQTFYFLKKDYLYCPLNADLFEVHEEKISGSKSIEYNTEFFLSSALLWAKFNFGALNC